MYPTGLVNTGNTCFLNCILQALASISSFKKFLESTKGGAFTAELRRTLHAIRGSTTSVSLAVAPIELIRLLSQFNPDLFADQSQQDAEELFETVMTLLDTERERRSKKASFFMGDSDEIINPFDGWLVTQLRCSKCGIKGALRNQSFRNISLAVPCADRARNPAIYISALSLLSRSTLRQCLDVFFKEEMIEKVSCPHCSIEQTQSTIVKFLKERKSTVKGDVLDDYEGVSMLLKKAQSAFIQGTHDSVITDFEDDEGRLEEKLDMHIDFGERCYFLATKTVLLSRLPTVLCFHIKRNVFCVDTGAIDKVTDHVQFPLRCLDMSKYFLPGPHGVDPRFLYSLRAIIVHIGSATRGHYVTYANHVLSDRSHWVMFSDEQVKQKVAPKEIEMCQAYMLFYTREEA